MKKLSLSIAMLVYMTIIGCSPSLKEVMDSWLGTPVERLIDSWGIPTQEYQMGDTTYLTYSTSRTMTHTNLPHSGYNMMAGINSTTYNLTCNKTMKVRDGIIVGYSYNGHCGW